MLIERHSVPVYFIKLKKIRNDQKFKTLAR